MSLKIGIQLYTVREHAAADPAGTLSEIARCGYEGVQFAGYYGYPADGLRALLDIIGLKAAGSHISFQQFAAEPEAQLRYAEALGLGSLSISYIDKHLFDQPQTTEQVARIAEQAARRGIRLSFHNHAYEFGQAGGEYKLDAFYRLLPGVSMELDTYWAAFAGVDPVAYMARYGSRLSAIHIKDMKKEPDERSVNASIGEGVLDIPGYLKKAEELGLEWAFVEMDKCDGDELACARRSRENLRKMGY